jgi:hypothetical protein
MRPDGIHKQSPKPNKKEILGRKCLSSSAIVEFPKVKLNNSASQEIGTRGNKF